jgi:phosphoenolpyruvate carboxylase
MADSIHIPRVMSTQHPDNATPPAFSSGPALSGEEEITEAYQAYSQLGCDEQMWDHEGKEVDEFVVLKLLTQHAKFFRKKKLGQKVFLTLRVPNPARERGTAKVLLEILESIPRSYDMAKHFYRADIAPIFEIILPMTTNTLELNRIWNYYREFVSGKADRPVLPGDITLKEWVGDFAPRDIRIIPLIEDMPSMLAADRIVEDYIQGKELPHQRVFLARSDPAMTYGSTSAVLLLKIALHRLHQLERKVGIPIYPIVGVGSAPFRGNFTPTNVKSRLKGYPSVQTFTVQSAFKFDYPEELVKSAVATIKKAERKAPILVEDESHLMPIIDKISKKFVSQVERLSPLINHVAAFVPARRKRRLHVGLFGYQRAVKGKRLPRAIGFCASFYSIGLPPELLGLATLNAHDIKIIIEHYPNFIHDLRASLMYFDWQSLSLLPPKIADDIQKTVRLLKIDPEPNLIHQALVRALHKLLEREDHSAISEIISQAARERKFLG